MPAVAPSMSSTPWGENDPDVIRFEHNLQRACKRGPYSSRKQSAFGQPGMRCHAYSHGQKRDDNWRDLASSRNNTPGLKIFLGFFFLIFFVRFTTSTSNSQPDIYNLVVLYLSPVLHDPAHSQSFNFLNTQGRNQTENAIFMDAYFYKTGTKIA